MCLQWERHDIIRIVRTQCKAPDIPPYLRFDAVIFAEQLTIIAANLHSQIKVCELEAWRLHATQDILPEQAPHINDMIRHSNAVRSWTLHEIIAQTNQQKQIRVMEYLIATADACRALNNFATLLSIISAMSAEPAQQVSRCIHAESQAKLVNLQTLAGPAKGYYEYRQVVRMAKLPCLPCIGSSTTPASSRSAAYSHKFHNSICPDRPEVH